jgi:hypothetical protein
VELNVMELGIAARLCRTRIRADQLGGNCDKGRISDHLASGLGYLAAREHRSGH